MNIWYDPGPQYRDRYISAFLDIFFILWVRYTSLVKGTYILEGWQRP